MGRKIVRVGNIGLRRVCRIPGSFSWPVKQACPYGDYIPAEHELLDESLCFKKMRGRANHWIIHKFANGLQL